MIRDHRTRQFIGGREIEIVIRGRDMGKRGPKRKEGLLRTPGGQISRSKSQAQTLTDLAASERRKIQATALKQPHRRGDDDPLLGSALGRFCKAARCGKETFDGVEAYAVAHQRWLVAMGKPAGYENASLGGTSEGPTAEQVKRWKAKIDDVDRALIRVFPAGIVGMVIRLAIDDIDLTSEQFERAHVQVRSALGEIAIVTGFLRSNPHPFR